MMEKIRGRFPYELVAVVLITAGYLALIVYSRVLPVAASALGQAMGVSGFILMLMTEVLYSVRKRMQRAAGWGSLQSWLRFHIFTGIVGPYLVLLHTGWRFGGLAGFVALMTGVVVVSGFFGRYLYNRVPRSGSGAELPGDFAEASINEAGAGLLQASGDNLAIAQRALSSWHVIHLMISGALFSLAFLHVAAALYYVTFAR